jgi:hypothetical protein
MDKGEARKAPDVPCPMFGLPEGASPWVLGDLALGTGDAQVCVSVMARLRGRDRAAGERGVSTPEQGERARGQHRAGPLVHVAEGGVIRRGLVDSQGTRMVKMARISILDHYSIGTMISFRHPRES